MNGRVFIELVLAGLALIGAGVSWVHTRSTIAVAPIIDGQPATSSVVYDPQQLVLTLSLVTVAGILVVVALARWRRESGRLLQQRQDHLTPPGDGVGQAAQGLMYRAGDREH